MLNADPAAALRSRHEFILQQALARKIVRTKELAQHLGVHEMTVRRDLDLLSEQGLLERVHGGARLQNKANDEVAYSLRINEHLEAKSGIAHKALELIQDGDTIALDASTTTLQLAHLLGGRTVNTIVSSLDAATILAGLNLPFTLTGGEFHARARSFVGAHATGTLKRLHPDKVFFSSKGFSIQTGFTDAHLPETEMKEQLIRSGRFIVALLDHTKFSRVALHTIVEMDAVDVVITDLEPDLETKEAFEAADIRLIVAGV